MVESQFGYCRLNEMKTAKGRRWTSARGEKIWGLCRILAGCHICHMPHSQQTPSDLLSSCGARLMGKTPTRVGQLSADLLLLLP